MAFFILDDFGNVNIKGLDSFNINQQLLVMNSKYVILYVVFGILDLTWVGYKVITTYPDVNVGRLLIHAVIAIYLLYMAYKAYHEKKDKELM